MPAAAPPPALPSYVDADHLLRCLEAALPGHRFRYAVGAQLDQLHPTVQLVAEWVAAGRAEHFPAERMVGGGWYYAVTRIGCRTGQLPAPAAAELPPKLAGKDADLLAWLIDVAERGAAMPRNRAVAVDLFLPDLDSLKYRLRKLNGTYIRIERRGVRATAQRRVTVIAGVDGAPLPRPLATAWGANW